MENNAQMMTLQEKRQLHWSQSESLCLVSRDARVMKVLNFTYTLQSTTQSNVVRSTLSDEKCHETHKRTERERMLKWVI